MKKVECIGGSMIANDVYKHIVNNSKYAYFYGEVILDKQCKIEDCKILDVNESFKNLFKLNEKNIINSKLSEILSCEFNLIEIINKAMINEKYHEVHYINKFEDWFSIDIHKINSTEFYVTMEKENQINEYTQTLLDVFPAGIWYKDKDGRYIASSKLMLNNDRVKDTKIKGKTDIQIQQSGKIAAYVMEHDADVMDNETFAEYNSFSSEDTVHSTQKHCVYDKSGNIIGTIGFYLDTTAHEKLKESYNNYKKLSDSLLQSIPDILVYKDKYGKYEYCNKSFLDYLGLTDERDVIGKYDVEVFEKNIYEQEFIPMTDKKVLESKEALRYVTNPVNNGEINYFDIIKTPFFNDEGEVIGITAVIRNINNLVLAKNNLKENEKQLNNILNGINDAIILSDKDNVIYVNKAFEDIFGIRRDDYKKNPNLVYELFTEEYKKILGKYDHRKAYNLEINVNAKDGKNKWIWYKGYPLDSENEDGKKITIIRDITAKKEHDLELERLKIEFFANITHELRTPLNLLFSSLQMIDLKMNSNEEDIKAYEKYINIIRQNSLRLLKLVNNLIDSTKVDSGYLNCKYENADIVNFTEQIFNSIEQYANSKNIELIFDTDTEEKMISFDMDKVERILLNLLSNAIKFNKENGKILLNMSVKEDYTEISIKDTGIGIPELKLESVFERFIQVNNRMTKISEGSGIGLSLSKSLIEILGGNISINSILDEGTEFIVTIPNIIKEDFELEHNLNGGYNSFVKKLEVEFSDIY